MNIAIAGYGVEGRANLRYWGGNGNTITILDEHEITDAPDGIAVRTGAGVFDDLSAFDMVVRTASLNPARLSSARATPRAMSGDCSLTAVSTAQV